MTKTTEKKMLQPMENGLKISKSLLQHFVQNSILEQAKVAKYGADYIEQAVQVKRQPVWWNSLKI